MKNYFEAIPVRIIPFDLGAHITDETGSKINDTLLKITQPKPLTQRESACMAGCLYAGTLADDCNYNIFDTGICVITIKDKSIELNTEMFAIDYGNNRKENHGKIFSWEHPLSEDIRRFIEALREIVHSSAEKIRLSGYNTFENQGMSYVMTLSFFHMPDMCVIFDKDKLPRSVKQNLSAILDPSILFLEDSAIYNNDSGTELKKRILSNLDDDLSYPDYEKRKHICAFMSWSSVIVLGNISEMDYLDYVSLEINLQNSWYYVYCLEKEIEDYSAENHEGLTQREVQLKINEISMYSGDLVHFRDSSLPSRYINLQKGLVRTSGLNTHINRYLSKLKNICKMLQLENQEKQRKYSRGSEILLMLIASMQIFPIVENIVRGTSTWITYVFIMIIALAGVVLLTKKNATG